MENIVRKRRKQCAMTQGELARLARVGRSTISNIETGKYIPGVDVALRIAKALNRTVEELFQEV